jgi:hypothetical protein
MTFPWTRVVPVLVGALVLGALGSLQAGSAQAATGTLEITVVPPLSGVRFALNGVTAESNQDGIVRFSAENGSYPLELLDVEFEREGLRAEFTRWSDSLYVPVRDARVRTDAKVQVGFDIYRPIDFHFVDLKANPVDEGRVSSVTVTTSIGGRETYETWETRWLQASRIVRRPFGLGSTDIRYLVESVIIDGTNVVNRSQLRFYPTQTQDWQMQLLLYSARIKAKDALFGFSLGSSIQLMYPDQHIEKFDLGPGSEVTLESLPRGEYKVKVDAWGYAPFRPVALSRNQEVPLKVFSYVDMLVVFLFLWVLVFGLLYAGRPHIFRRSKRKRLTVAEEPDYWSFRR